MLNTNSLMYDYAVENAKFFNEFDQSNFIANASLAINNKVVNFAVSTKGNQYSHILEKAISYLNSIEIDSYAVSEFITKVIGSPRIDSSDLTMSDISKLGTIVMKPQYLAEAVLNYKEVVNGIASGKYTTDKIKIFYANIDAYIATLKKRLVTSNIKINITPEGMLQYDKPESIKVTTKYLQDTVIPFLQDVPKTKKLLSDELTSINSSVCTTLSELKTIVDDINTGISLNKLDDTQKKLMLNYTYNQVRAIMEGISFITYAAIRKAHQFENAVVACQNMYNTLTLIFNDANMLIEAGAFDSKVISSTDAHNMAEKLVEGSNDVFAELAHNIMEYHRGYIASHNMDEEIAGGDVEDYMTTMLKNTEYNKDVYTNIVKAYIEIGNGLDILAKNVDDRMIVYDDAIKKSGFMVELVDRFHNEIDALDNLCGYGITDLEIGNGAEKSSVYRQLLSEIDAYPQWTHQIANAAKTIYTKAHVIADMLDDKRNGELAYCETMNEIKIFINSFNDQFEDLNTEIIKGLYYRLKALAAKADDCLDNVYSTPESDLYDSDDFFREAAIANVKELDSMNDIVMERLLKEYYAEREFKERGVRLVYEADSDTSVKVTDNSQSTGTDTGSANAPVSNDKLSNLMKSIGEWFEKMIASFEDVLGRQKAKNLKWLSENKERLTTRSYSNVEIQILPYDKMPKAQISQDINKLANAVGTMNPAALKTINNYEEIRNRLINFGPKFTKDKETVTITNYYKVGNNPLQTVSYANNNIKNIVVNEMIPYCEQFYDAYKEEIKKQLSSLKTSMENVTKSYVTESVNIYEFGSLFTEADAQTQTTTTQSSDQVGLSQKAGWIKQCIQNYSGAVLNAIRDRNNDYFKVLYALAPKATTTPNKPAAETSSEESNQTA